MTLHAYYIVLYTVNAIDMYDVVLLTTGKPLWR